MTTEKLHNIKNIEKFYNDIPFDEADKSELKSKFFSFGEVLSTSVKYLKLQWIRVYLTPFLWKSLITSIFIFIAIILSYLTIYADYNLIDSSLPPLASAPLYLAWVLTVLLLIFIFWLVMTAINISATYLLNNKSVAGISDTSTGIKKLFPFISLSIILAIIYNFFNFINLIINSIMVAYVKSMYNFATELEAIVNLEFLVFPYFRAYQALMSIISIIFTIWITTKLSNSIYIFIFENKGVVNSIKQSWKMTKEYFWQELFRKFLGGLALFMVYTILTIIALIIILVTLSLTNFSNANLLLATIFIVFIFIIFSVLIWMITESFLYVCFVNYRLLTNSAKEKIYKEEIEKTTNKNQPNELAIIND